jgi:hypothetical protein
MPARPSKFAQRHLTDCLAALGQCAGVPPRRAVSHRRAFLVAPFAAGVSLAGARKDDRASHRHLIATLPRGAPVRCGVCADERRIVAAMEADVCGRETLVQPTGRRGTADCQKAGSSKRIALASRRRGHRHVPLGNVRRRAARRCRRRGRPRPDANPIPSVGGLRRACASLVVAREARARTDNVFYTGALIATFHSAAPAC